MSSLDHLETWAPLKPPELPDEPCEYVPATDYPVGHKMVLLMLRRGPAAQKILDHFKEMGAEPSKEDWREMIEAGLITRRQKGSSSRLELTPRGLYAAGEIMRDCARRYGEHEVTIRTPRGSGYTAGCLCGWRICEPATWNGERRLQRYAGQHMAAARAGTLKEPEPVAQMIDRILEQRA